jgi:hypothetical protein
VPLVLVVVVQQVQPVLMVHSLAEETVVMDLAHQSLDRQSLELAVVAVVTSEQLLEVWVDQVEAETLVQPVRNSQEITESLTLEAVAVVEILPAEHLLQQVQMEVLEL